jgi:hypothetical protein
MIGSGILKGYKTYVVGIVSVLGFVTGYLIGDVSLADAANGVVTAVLAMTVRSGINSAVAK